METNFTKDFIYEKWADGTSLVINEKAYTVHKMSYGDYFLEPSSWKGGEKDGFSNETIWLEKSLGKNHQVIYKIKN